VKDPLHELSATRLRCYRFIPASAVYSPTSGHPGSGRFDNGTRLTLYVSSDAEGAAAEFFRRHPELLPLQGAVSLRVFEMELTTHTPLLDVRTEAGATAAGTTLERMTSSDADEAVRYGECRTLADRVDARFPGIAWPSAAYSDSIYCVVLFGMNRDRWYLDMVSEIAKPLVDVTRVQVIQAA
jgi:hypothetical protein